MAARLVLVDRDYLLYLRCVVLYVSEFGQRPYDAIAPTIVDQTKANYRVVRVIQDVAFALIGLLTGGPIGIGTFISAFSGPTDQILGQPCLSAIHRKQCQKAIFK